MELAVQVGSIWERATARGAPYLLNIFEAFSTFSFASALATRRVKSRVLIHKDRAISLSWGVLGPYVGSLSPNDKQDFDIPSRSFWTDQPPKYTATPHPDKKAALDMGKWWQQPVAIHAGWIRSKQNQLCEAIEVLSLN
jgi:hypothetical protein